MVVVVDTERGESGLAALLGEDEKAESGLCVLGDAPGIGRDLPCIISRCSDGDGFHDVLWKLFFLRTLALYAARIALVASCVLMNSDDAPEVAEAMLGAGDPVISKHGRFEVE